MTLLLGVHTQNEFFRFYMPYHFQKLQHHRFQHVYLPLNRKYLPLGEMDGRPDFRAHFDRCVVFDNDPHHFGDVWYEPIGLYLYGDGPESKRDYSERLGRLLSRRMRIVGEVR